MKNLFTLTAIFSSMLASSAFAESSIHIEQNIKTSGNSETEIRQESSTIEMRVPVGGEVNLDISSSEDGRERTHTWKQVSGPFIFDTREGGNISLTPQVAGTYEFELIAEEDGRSFVEKRATVIVEGEGSGSATTVIRESNSDSVRIERSVPSQGDRTEPILESQTQDDEVSDQDIDANDGLDRNVVITGDSDTDLRILTDLKVSGVEVRGWDPDKKAEVLAHVSSRSEITTANDFGQYVASIAISQEDIEEITVTEDAVEITYPTRIHLFGLIPMNVTAIAKAETDGEAAVHLPWYASVSTKTSQEAYTTLVQQIKAKHDMAKNILQNIKS